MKITKNRLSVLFRHEILPDNRGNDLESNELCTYLGKTGNTGKTRILVKITKNRFLPVFPVLPILVHSSFDSKSFSLSPGKI